MKKIFLSIIFLVCSIYVVAEENFPVTSDTSDVVPDVINSSTTTAQVNKSTDTINISTNTITSSTGTINLSKGKQIVTSTDTVNVSSSTGNIDITKPLKYKEVKADKSIEVSSMTVIPDENDLGTYYASGAIVEKPQKDTDYDLNIPTTTALGIAGDKVLDKLEPPTPRLGGECSILLSYVGLFLSCEIIQQNGTVVNCRF
ncbi:MAG: hypothetical protein II669_04800, partial [Elusimicrobia bacterium]|nr:hypothetical protein [Elusimicrobiota bacterium]